MSRRSRSNGDLKNIKVPRIYRELDLSEYADGLPAIHVWVNPPRRAFNEFHELQQHFLGLPSQSQEPKSHLVRAWRKLRRLWRSRVTLPKAEREIVAWYGRIWSPDGVKPFDEQEVIDFAVQITEEDPELWAFMTARTMQLIREHRESAKKNLMMR